MAIRVDLPQLQKFPRVQIIVGLEIDLLTATSHIVRSRNFCQGSWASEGGAENIGKRPHWSRAAATVGFDTELQQRATLPWCFVCLCRAGDRYTVTVSGRFRATGEARLRRVLESRTGKRQASSSADEETWIPQCAILLLGNSPVPRPFSSADRSIRSAMRMRCIEGQRVNVSSPAPDQSLVSRAGCRCTCVYCRYVSYSGGQKSRIFKIVSTLKDKREDICAVIML
jgi:hypothetical protein